MNTPTTLLDLIRDDAHAAGFQSLGQYRKALIEAATAAATITIGETHSPVKVRLGLRLIGDEEVATITLTQHDKTVILHCDDQAHAARIAAAIEALPAAPAVQGEPVATIHVDGSFVHVAWRIPAPSRCAMDVYTAPQPAEQQPTPDVTALVEALERSVAGFDALSTMTSLDAGARNYARQKAIELNASLATYRQKGEA